jgi:hypothetical protein
MTRVIPSERSQLLVTPTERSEWRDLHLWFLTESTENTEDRVGVVIPAPDRQNHLGLWMERTDAPVRASRHGRQLSVLSVLSVRNERHQAIRPFPRDRASRSAFRRSKSTASEVST